MNPSVRCVGIEDASTYLGLASIGIDSLFRSKGLDPRRMSNLMMVRKTVALPCEDVVSYAVNAARPLLDRLGGTGRESVELLVLGTESGIDMSKSAATWIHELLGLPRTCRLFEVKQACYAGIAALQLAAAHMSTAARPDARALVIGCDVPRLVRGSTAEPSQGAGAVAVLVGAGNPLAVAEHGAAGYCSFDVTDVRRPTSVDHIWDPDLSLMSYLKCLKTAYSDYTRRQPGTDILTTFDYLVFHTPFPGAVLGAHRSLLRTTARLSPAEIAEDFERRMGDSIRYPAQVGNIYAGTTLLALLSLLDQAKPDPYATRRVGIFSYGSGCSSEFCSYLLPPQQASRQHWNSGAADMLRARTALEPEAYEDIAEASAALSAGVANYRPGTEFARQLAQSGRMESPRPLIMLESIRDHYRSYTEITGGAA